MFVLIAAVSTSTLLWSIDGKAFCAFAARFCYFCGASFRAGGDIGLTCACVGLRHCCAMGIERCVRGGCVGWGCAALLTYLACVWAVGGAE